MHNSASHEKRAKHGSSQTGPVSVVIVVSALPERESIGEEVVITVSTRAAQDVGDERQARLGVRGRLHGGIDLRLGRRLGRLAISTLFVLAASLELLLDLVGMERAGLSTVGLGDLVVGGGGRYTEDIVEGGSRIGLMGRDFVTDAEDLAV